MQHRNDCPCANCKNAKLKTVKVNPDAHLGAEQGRFEVGYHEELDRGVETC